MNVVVVQGVISREPTQRSLPDASVVLDWQVTTGENGDKRTVPVQWADPPAAVAKLGEGAEVLVFGAVRTRWFRTKGLSVSRVEVEGIAHASPKRAASVARLLGRAEAALER